MKKTILLLSVSTLLTGISIAQNTTQPELESGTIENQFDYIITKSSSFKDFQLIRKTSILKVKNNALDSLRNTQSELNKVNQSIIQFRTEIKQLEDNVANLKSEIELTAQDKDSINFLGKQFSKTSYNTIVWSLVTLLLAALLFFIYQFKNNQILTKKTKEITTKIENELDDFKKKAMKKEQELMRKLQDEINKNTH